MKDNQGREGYMKCPHWLRIRYLQEANLTCMETGKKCEAKELDVHRLIRGNKGGLYTICPLKCKASNVKVVTKIVHKKYHENEKGCGR